MFENKVSLAHSCSLPIYCLCHFLAPAADSWNLKHLPLAVHRGWLIISHMTLVFHINRNERLWNNNTLIEVQGRSYDLLSKANILNVSKAPAPTPAFVHSPYKSQEHMHVHLWHLLNDYRCDNSFPWLSNWEKCWSALIYWRELRYWNPGITPDMIQVLKNNLRRTFLNSWMFNLPYLMSLLLVFYHERRHKRSPRLCFRNPSSCLGQVKQANKLMKKREGVGESIIMAQIRL